MNQVDRAVKSQMEGDAQILKEMTALEEQLREAREKETMVR